jgi:hypothetical protein
LTFLRRRPSIPAALKPPLEREERILTWASLSAPADQILVATNRGLWLPDGTRLGWHDVHKAAWSQQELRLIPAEVAQQRQGYAVLVDGPVRSFALIEPGELPDQVRTRVTRSVGYTSHHPLTVGGVRVVGRRVSGKNGLTWGVRYDAGTPVELASVVELTDELVAAARGATTVE